MKNIKIEFKWAILFTLMMLLWMLMEKLLGFHSDRIEQHPVISNFIAIPAIAVYVFALLDKKRNHYNGIMNYKQGFVSGLIITIIVSCLTPLTQYITSVIISPEYFPNVIHYTVSKGMMDQPTAEAYFNLKNYIIQGTFGALFMGIVTAAIVAFFVRTKEQGK